jgi:hypothetical protein
MTILITFVTLILTWPFYAAPARSLPEQAAQDQKAPAESIQITYGPVVESVTDTTAIIAWSTNVNAGTVLRYGSDPKHLDRTAGMPWGGLTHRVNLKDLKPNTVYYFEAESPKGQGTGSTVSAPQSSFRTKNAATCTGLCA